jgi:hypothetical protein
MRKSLRNVGLYAYMLRMLIYCSFLLSFYEIVEVVKEANPDPPGPQICEDCR